MIDAVDEIVELLAAGVLLALHGKLDAIAGGAAIVGIKDGHAPRGRDLTERVIQRQPAIGIMRLRPTMHGQDEWIAFALLFVERPDEDAFELEAIASLVLDD